MGDPLHPDPPHLEVGVHPRDGMAAETFAACCAAVLSLGGVSTGWLRLAPRRRVGDPPTAASDVADDVRVWGQRWWAAVRGTDTAHTPVAAGFRMRRIGRVVVSAGSARDRQPAVLRTYGCPLATPRDLWDRRDRSRAVRLEEWARQALAEVAAAVAPLYGHIALARPPSLVDELTERERLLDGSVYLANEVIRHARFDPDEMNRAFPKADVLHWSTGICFSAWNARDGLLIPEHQAAAWRTSLTAVLRTYLNDHYR